MFEKIRRLFRRPRPARKIDLWREFRGLGNSDEVLARKARFLAPLLVHIGREQATWFRAEVHKHAGIELRDDTLFQTMVETSVFFVHYFDRLAFSCLSDSQRNVFTDTLVLEIGEEIGSMYDTAVDASRFRRKFLRRLNTRQVEYSAYNSEYPAKGDAFAGTLYWEYSKNIAATCGCPKSIELVSMAMTSLMSAITSYNLDGLLTTN